MLMSAKKKRKKKNMAKVLEEDSYQEALEHIIQRDFYPDLPKLRTQAQYLDALEKNDMQKLNQIKLSLAQSTQGTFFFFFFFSFFFLFFFFFFFFHFLFHFIYLFMHSFVLFL